MNEPTDSTLRQRFEAIAGALRDLLAQRWLLTRRTYDRENPKQVYYLSMEFLLGRSFTNNLTNTMVEPRKAIKLGRRLLEVPVGFKWFVDGLHHGSLAFAGEESAGASFLRRDGTVWTTDKDGMIMGLLAAEMTAVMGRDPGDLYQQLTHELGEPVYQRLDAPVTPEQKRLMAQLSPHQITVTELAGETHLRRLIDEAQALIDEALAGVSQQNGDGGDR